MVTFIGGFFSAGIILKNGLNFIQLENVTIAATSPFQFITVAMDIGFFLAIFASVPYIIYSFYVFIIPALSRRERKGLLKTIPLSFALFIVGFVYGSVILYYSLALLAAINTGLGIANFWNVSQFLSEVFITAALLGFIFEFPLLLTLLIKLGIITVKTLENKRRIAIFLMFFIAGLLPPTDILSLVAMVLPLVVLFEMTILLNKKKKYVWTWSS